MSVYIDKELCKSCGLCLRSCPKNVFDKSGQVNKKGYEYMAAAHQDDCIKCKLCQKVCPDFAIYVE